MYPWWGTMETPLGIFYFGPPFPEQETPSNIPGFAYIEGVGQIRTGSPDGPVVGVGFCEMVDIIAPFPARELPEEELFMDFSKVNR